MPAEPQAGSYVSHRQINLSGPLAICQTCTGQESRSTPPPPPAAARSAAQLVQTRRAQMSERTVHVGDASSPTLEGPGSLQGVSLPPAIQFDSNLDELVDANLRFIASTQWGARQRRRCIAWTVLAFILSMLMALAVMSGVTTSEGLLMLAALATVLGLAFGLIYRSGYDALVRSRLRRVLREQLGDRSPWRCEIELRPEGAWSRDHGVELLFSWGDSAAVEDGAAGVELRFRAGFILARAHAFATPDERRRFVEAARSLAESHRTSPPRA